MTTGIIVFWLLVGWCGTPPRWPWPWPPDGPWPPFSFMSWFILKFISMIGGLIGGWLTTQSWFAEQNAFSGTEIIATSIGAFVGSVLLTDIVSLVAGQLLTQRKAQ